MVPFLNEYFINSLKITGLHQTSETQSIKSSYFGTFPDKTKLWIFFFNVSLKGLLIDKSSS